MNMAVLQLHLPHQPAALRVPAQLPLLPPEKPEKFIDTDLGIEKYCPHCDEYWPLDDAFWWPRGTSKKGGQLWSSVCKACYDERYKRGRFKFQPATGVQS